MTYVYNTKIISKKPLKNDQNVTKNLYIYSKEN